MSQGRSRRWSETDRVAGGGGREAPGSRVRVGCTQGGSLVSLGDTKLLISSESHLQGPSLSSALRAARARPGHACSPGKSVAAPLRSAVGPGWPSYQGSLESQRPAKRCSLMSSFWMCS